MPMGDRTGPTGQGPRTGRAAGYCAGMEEPGCVHRGPGFGSGRGGGRGRGGHGWRHRLRAGGQTTDQQAQSSLHAVESPRTAVSDAGEAMAAANSGEEQRLRREVSTLQQELIAIREHLRQLETRVEPPPAGGGPAPA